MNVTEIDWQPFLDRLQRKDRSYVSVYPGNLKADLLAYAGFADDARGEIAYQLAVEISRLTTPCDPEIVYWFSRLICLTTLPSAGVDRKDFTLI